MSGRGRRPSTHSAAVWVALLLLVGGLAAGSMACGEASAPESAGPTAEPLVAASAEQPPSEARADRASRLRRLAAAEARRQGLDAAPEVRAALEKARREAAAREEEVLRDALFARIRDGLVFSEEELRAHYEAHRVRYTERRVRLRQQAFASEEAARAAQAALGPEGRLDPAAAEELGACCRLGGHSPEGVSITAAIAPRTIHRLFALPIPGRRRRLRSPGETA